jgi:anti-sigma factor RsiW
MSLLHHLDPESLLLLYQAGEFSPADRAQVEQMLGADPALRVRLADLAAANDSISSVLSRLDPPIAAPRREAAVRAVARALSARQLERLAYAGPTTKSARRPLKLRRLVIPLAAAAALVLGVFLWPRNIELPGTQQAAIEDVEFPDVLAFDRNPEPQTDSLGKLEQELVSLSSNPRTLDADAWELTDEQ